MSDSGIIIKTINGGNSWTLLPSGTNFNLYSIHFPTENVGYAVGEHELVLKTTDKGASWTAVCNWGGDDLFTVNFIDPLHGIVGGDNDVLMRTSDGGLNWVTLVGGGYGWFFSVCMTDTNTAFAAGGEYQWGKLYKITGDYSYLLTCGVKNWLLSVHFPDANTGFVAGQGGTIFKTDNGGGPVGVSERKVATNSLKLYPNPTSGNLTIEAPEKGTLFVFNLNGGLKLQQKITKPTTTADVSKMPEGLYVVKVVGEKKVFVGKFIKQN
ncbi:MAG: T9SS type A sorting domain-containing protein [Bacteroidota bacterium]